MTAITAMAKNVANAVSIAQWVQEGVPNTNREAVQREIPNCQACDRPVFGRVVSGYDMECYERKRYLGISDRAEFRRARLAELAAEEGDDTGWRIAEIDRLQSGADLPKGSR